MNRKKLILAVLLVVLVITVIISFFRMPKQDVVAPLKGQPAPAATKPRAVAKEAPAAPPQAMEGKLRLDLLQKERPLFTGFRRNIFKPLFAPEAPPREVGAVRPAPKPTGGLIPAPPAPIPPAPVPTAPPPPPLPPPLPRPQPDLVRFTFIGFLQRESQKTIFLSKDKEIFVVKKGDKLAGKYEATNITEEALTIRVLQDGGEIVIPLLENKPLIPARK